MKIKNQESGIKTNDRVTIWNDYKLQRGAFFFEKSFFFEEKGLPMGGGRVASVILFFDLKGDFEKKNKGVTGERGKNWRRGRNYK